MTNINIKIKGSDQQPLCFILAQSEIPTYADTSALCCCLLFELCCYSLSVLLLKYSGAALCHSHFFQRELEDMAVNRLKYVCQTLNALVTKFKK